MLAKLLFGFFVGLGFAIGGGVTGFSISLMTNPPDAAWIYIPISCAGVAWTFGFTLGIAHINLARLEDDHSPTPPDMDYEVPVVERKMVETAEGGWLLVDFKEVLKDGQRQQEE